MMWDGLFKTKDTRKRAAPAAALTPPRSGSAKKLKQNETPTREDLAPRAVAPPMSTNGLRSMAAAHKSRDLLMPGADMCCLPAGLYETENEIIEAVQAWAADLETNGGAFGIPPRRESLKPAGKMKGPRRLLVCDRGGQANRSKVNGFRPKQRTKKCNCTWGIFIEECEEGWITVEIPKKARELLRQPGATVTNIHNHALLQTVAESNTSVYLRSIPADLKDMAETLSWAACSPNEIFLALSRECQRLGRAVTFTRKDIANKYLKQSGNNTLDCQNFTLYLRDRQSEDSSLPLDFHLSQDQDHILERVLFVVKGGIERWKRCKAAVLRYDTGLGTNQYDHKIGCLAYIDDTGKAQVLAISLLLHEDEEALKWVFEAFQKAFGDDPVVAFTDSDPAMAPAIALAWPNTLHLLCDFPLIKNFYKHIHPLFVQRPNEWKIAAIRWWKLCEDSDESSMQERFPAEFDALATFIAGNSNTTETMWLQRVKESVLEWAASYT